MHAHRFGVTLIEILVVLTIIMILAGLLLPGIAIVRDKANRHAASQTVQELQVALDLYRRDDVQRRYPVPLGDLSIGSGLLEDLDRRGLWSWGDRERDSQGRLLDPWGFTYAYSLVRPTPGFGTNRLLNWNWDVDAGREARWGERPLANGGRSTGALPFAYIWSYGRNGRTNDATEWIFPEDGA
jgi:type II secretory pathway pseudopilin PulG